MENDTKNNDSPCSSGDQPNLLEDKTIFPDFKTGPLTEYRQKSSFCHKTMNVLLEGEDYIRLKHRVWTFMERHPDFQHETEMLPLNTNRRLSNKRFQLLFHQNFYDFNDNVAKPDLVFAIVQAIFSYDFSFGLKYYLSHGLFPFTILSLGTDRLAKYVGKLIKGEILGAYALTEISHGTNARGMRTRATYDADSKEFILHTPDFEAAKCWVGNLGKTCTHAVVYAQLYAPDDEHQGLNAFVVPIRNERTLQAFPGVTVGDMGEKIGFHGMDNGFVMFNNYRIPKENLLSGIGDLDDNGEYQSPIKDNRKRLAATLSTLSAGRVHICAYAYFALSKAITIATRYSVSRRQFGRDDKCPEWPVIEFQTQQYRLFPHLATTYALRIFSLWLGSKNSDRLVRSLMGEDVSKLNMELHALSSAAKPVCTWAARDGIQECREACGGHGFLKCAGIGDLRNDNDAGCTYEGENNTLIQQASNWLINLRRSDAKYTDVSPMGSVAFLQNFDQILQSHAEECTAHEVMDPKNLLKALDWLLAWQLDMTTKHAENLKTQGNDAFETRNNMQVFYAQQLSIIYGERTIFYTFYEFVNAADPSCERNVLEKLLSFYGANLVMKHVGLFYQGGYYRSPNQIALYQDGILEMLPVLKDEAISLTDAIAPTDFILNSALGMSDGNVYQHLQRVIVQTPGTFERPKWWQEVTYKDFLRNSKL